MTTCGERGEQSERIECAICLEAIDEREACRLKCGHAFHSSCMIQSALHDPRCPVCRAELAQKPAPAAGPSVLNIELTMGDVQEAFEQDFQTMRRQQLNYDARRRRFLRRHPDMLEEHMAAKRGELQLRTLERGISERWSQASRELWLRPEFVALRKERSLLLRRIRRRERTVEEAVEEALGERPEIDDDGEESQVMRAIARAGRQRLDDQQAPEEDEEE